MLWHNVGVTFDLSNLPEDPSLLQQMLTELLQLLQDKDRKISSLQHQIALLKRSMYGPRSEKIDPEQLRLAFAELQAAVASGQEEIQGDASGDEEVAGKKRSNGHGRRPLPSHLPVEEQDCPIDEAKLTCKNCHTPLAHIGDDTSEELEYRPARFFIRRFKRPKYACPECHDGVVMGDLPYRPIEGGMAGPGLLSHVVVSKYADHQPLNRLRDIFLREGVDLAKSTLCGWVATVSSLLKPIYKAMVEVVLESKAIGTDDTPVKVLDPELHKKTRTGRVWVYVGDPDHPFTVFDYTPSRKRDGPKRFLRGYKGFLQADAYRGYDAIYAGKSVVEVACAAHARRKFFDAQSEDPEHALVALAFFKRLYQIERTIKGMSPEERRSRRQQDARPIMDDFKEWLEAIRQKVLPKGAMGTAIGYTLGHWPALRRYLTDGILEIDNNRSERALRKIAVGRGNWTFFGADTGGDNAAVLYSIMASCRRHGVNPFEYVRDLLTRISTHPSNQIRELLPDRWPSLVGCEIEMVADESPIEEGAE